MVRLIAVCLAITMYLFREPVLAVQKPVGNFCEAADRAVRVEVVTGLAQRRNTTQSPLQV